MCTAIVNRGPSIAPSSMEKIGKKETLRLSKSIGRLV